MFGEELYMQYAKEKNKKSGVSSFDVVTDAKEITAFESETGKQIGVLDNAPYYNINLDLCKDKTTGKVFRYAHIEYPNDGKTGSAVLVVLKTKEQDLYVLEKHYRFFTNKYHYEIPRGFAELSENPKLTAIREVYEETGIQIKEQHMISLGTVFPDTGLCNAQVNLYVAELVVSEAVPFVKLDEMENIHSYKTVSAEKFKRMIVNDEINDAFTMSAVLKYQALK